MRRMLANIGYLGVSQITGRILGFALMVVLARSLGEQGFGQLTYAFSWLLIGNIIADFGIGSLIVREVAQDHGRAGEYLAASITLKVGIALITMIALVGLNAGIGVRGKALEITGVVLLLLPFLMILSSCGAIFQAYERMGMCGAMDVSRVTLTLLGVLAMIPLGLDVRTAAYAYLGGAATVAVLFLWFTRRLIQQQLDYSRWGAIFRLAHQALPFLSIALLGTIQERSSILLLGRLQAPEQVAWYGAAYELITGLMLTAVTVSMAAYPVFSRTWILDRTTMNILSGGTLKYSVLLGVGMGVGLFVVAPEVTELVYGSAYREAATALRILAVGIPVFFKRTVLSVLLTAVDRLRSLFLINLGALLLNLLGGWLLISAFGHRGAAVITLLASTIALVGCVFAAPKELRKASFSWYPRTLLAGLLMGIVVVSLGPMNLFLKMGAGVLTYVVGLFAVGCLTRKELRRITTLALSRG